MGLISCFKGAMTFQPWILSRVQRAPPPGDWLQRSHDLSAMDTGAGRGGGGVGCGFKGAMTFQPWIHDQPRSI